MYLEYIIVCLKVKAGNIMIEKHFEKIASTQSYLLENLDFLTKHDKEVLISSHIQESGHGQYGRSWVSDTGSLCFSITLQPNPTLSLSSLEIGIHLVNFFETYFNKNLKLKWPNDIYDEDANKCAGILINNPAGLLVVGIGINLSEQINNDSNFNTGHLNVPLKNDEKAKLAKQIYQYINSHRLSAAQTLEQWKSHCIHMEKSVKILDTNKKDTITEGKFTGIGNFGEALIEVDNVLTPYYSGSLIFND